MEKLNCNGVRSWRGVGWKSKFLVVRLPLVLHFRGQVATPIIIMVCEQIRVEVDRWVLDTKFMAGGLKSTYHYFSASRAKIPARWLHCFIEAWPWWQGWLTIEKYTIIHKNHPKCHSWFFFILTYSTKFWPI